MSYSLVWFKRDLRWQDHKALAAAAQAGPVRCLYVVEPGLWQQPDMALQHFHFVQECLVDVHQHLQSQGGGLEVRTGSVTEVLSAIWQQDPFTQLHSHEETGNGWTYERDTAVAAWCQAHGVTWHEHRQFGVVRRLRDRNTWQAAWETTMAKPLANTHTLRFWTPTADAPSPHGMRAPSHLVHNPPARQRGGRQRGLSTLNGFLHTRSLGYRGGISSPLTAPDACSRLSPHLAWGSVGLRETVQQTRAHIAALPPEATRHRAGLQAFMSRLYWHCHFIQKLESEPAIEWVNMHRGYDGLRENDHNPAHFEALTSGRTGWPLVDACVAMLEHTGWLNFRMRAMLVSVAAYPLWLHWRPVGLWLATRFLDYEPGIHWSQMQMQSGTTGINTTRVYNPIKQAQDHDPHGRFVRRWLPALRQVPDSWLLEPWRMPTGLLPEVDLPTPPVDLAAATRGAKTRLHERRRDPEVRAGKAAVIDKHASRQGWAGQGRRKTPPPASGAGTGTAQLGFDF